MKPRDTTPRRSTIAVLLALAACGAIAAGIAARTARRTTYAGSRLVCVPLEGVDAPPAADGSFAIGGVSFLPPGELAPAATMIGDGVATAGDGLDAAKAIAAAVAPRVPHVLAYGDADDPTRPAFDPESALDTRREAEHEGTCITRAALLTLELWRRGHPARVAQLLYPRNYGHVVAEVWSARAGRWVAIDPSLGAYLTLDGQPAPISVRMTAPARYAWVPFAPAAPAFPVLEAREVLGDRPRVQRIAWPEPWLLARKGPRAATLLRSTFVVASGPDEQICALLDASRAIVAAGLLAAALGLIGAGVLAIRRHRSPSASR